jgi:hypothetical protein
MWVDVWKVIERLLQNRTIKNEHNNQRTEIRLRRVVVQDQVTVPSSEMFPARFHLCHIQHKDERKNLRTDNDI